VIDGDLGTEAIAYGFLTTLEGFIQSESTADQPHSLGLQERSELLALTVQRAYETGRSVSPAVAKTIATRVIGLFTDLVEGRPPRARPRQPNRSEVTTDGEGDAS
jgi:hypothetical protein